MKKINYKKCFLLSCLLLSVYLGVLASDAFGQVLNDEGSYVNEHNNNSTESTIIIVNSFPSPGSGPEGLAWDGNYLWNVDQDSGTIYQLDTSGNVISSFLAPGSTARGLTWDGNHLWFCAKNSNTVYELDTSGNIISSFPSPGNYPTGLAWDGEYLWLSDYTPVVSG